ncbi:MAG: mechanosensitive ion channel domain-containing protein [Xanthomarina sp.]
MNLENWTEKGIEFITLYGLKLVGAIFIWTIGSWIIKKLINGARAIMIKRDIEVSLQKFLLNILGWTLKILLVLSILSQVGIETTSFAAVLAAAGLAVGLALQGSLGNFAGGILIMLFKPFKIGDFIKAQGESGTVKEIEIFTTKLRTSDNKEVIIPNGSLSNGIITNFSKEDTRRVDFNFGVGYDSDIKKTKEVILSVILSNPAILKEPAPAVNVSELGDSSINFFTRVWVKKEDFWAVNFDTIERTKEALDAAGIDIPYPHQIQIQK